MRMYILPAFFTVCLLFVHARAIAGSAEYGSGGGGTPAVEQAPDIEALKFKATSGDVKSIYLVGKAYDEGVGVEQDYAEAAKWYQKAVDKGDFLAPGKLGVLLAKGQGVEQDYVRARTMFLISAQNGDPDAQTYLAFLLAGGLGGEKDYQGAATWFKKASAMNSPLAQYNLAILYDKGLGVPHNDDTALKWYREAAQHGNADAAFALGQAYFTGKGRMGRDLIESYAWLSFADAMGNTEAATIRQSVTGSLSTKELTKAQIQFKNYLAAYSGYSEEQ